MHIMFTSESEAGIFLASANTLLGYPKANIDHGTGQPDGTFTETWAQVIKHPAQDKWAVPYTEELEPIIGSNVPVELDPSWFPDDVGIPA